MLSIFLSQENAALFAPAVMIIMINLTRIRDEEIGEGGERDWCGRD
jgi:hypothetical protein